MSVTDPPSGRRRSLPARSWVILLVDDEPDVVQVLADLIEAMIPGTKVLPATSGRQALELLRRERVDAIISDFKMSGMDGIEFLFQARAARPNVPRAMLTAYADADLVGRATQEAQVQGFISKVASPDEFLDRVASLLNYTPTVVPGP